MVVLPSMFYSMFGMNVALPFQREAWAFAVVVALSFAFTLLIFAYARSRRFL
jgi:Mg2+ and Co2+ transporter CorA